MVLITGGYYQGKTAYALENFTDNIRIYNNYHLEVRQQLLDGKVPMAEAEKLLADYKENVAELVIISAEVGCGLVPADAFEREYREQCGRVSCYFAGEASRVIRVVCGIGSRLK